VSGGGRTPTVRTLNRALDILFCLADDQEPLSLLDISQRAGLEKSTAYRLLKALAARGMVKVSEQSGRYRLGLAILALSGGMLGAADLRSVARPYMQHLHELANETVALAVLADGYRVFVFQIESQHELRWVVQIGQRVPLYLGAAAKVMLAYLPADEQERIIRSSDFKPLTANTPRNASELRGQLTEICGSGIAKALGERVSGIIAVAAPVFDYTERVIASITVCGAQERFDDAGVDRIRQPLAAAALSVSRQLGFQGEFAALAGASERGLSSSSPARAGVREVERR
jgi:DNA-binding IclR family transcriptional regulator